MFWKNPFQSKTPKHRILVFHRIVADDTPPLMLDKLSGELMTQNSFAQQLKWHARRHKFVDLQGFLNAAPESSTPLATVTLDDGYADNFTNALPVLQALHIPATIFMLSGSIDQPQGMPHHRLARAVAEQQVKLPGKVRISPDLASKFDPDTLPACDEDGFLTTGQLKALVSAGIAIESHGSSHTPMTQLSTQAQALELDSSKQILEAITEQPVRYFAYPIGREQHFDQPSQAAVRHAGYQAAFTTVRAEWSVELDPFALPRWGMRQSAARSIKSLRL